VEINRAPIQTLWAVVVAERLGYGQDTALTLGRALAGLNAQSKGRALGVFQAKEKKKAANTSPGVEVEFVELTGRSIPVTGGNKGYVALAKGKPMDPESVRRHPDKKFGVELEKVMNAMRDLASSYASKELQGAAFALYEKFRPEVPKGAKGELHLSRIKLLVR
jgi:hypothetical protein